MKATDTQGYLTEEEVRNFEGLLREPTIPVNFRDWIEIATAKNPNATDEGYSIKEDGTATIITELIKKGESYPLMKIGKKRVSYEINKMKIGFAIPIEDVQNSRLFGNSLDSEYAMDASDDMNRKVDQMIWLGDEKFQVPGIFDIAGTTTHTMTDWDTAGLDIANEIIGMVNAVPQKYRTMTYGLFLADAEYVKLTKFFNSASAIGDRSHLERIKQAMPNLTIYNDANITAGLTSATGNTTAAGTMVLAPRRNRLCRFKFAKVPYFLTKNEVMEEEVKGAYAARSGQVELPFPSAVVISTGA